jgi:ketosteroid isomerase-like protein
VSNVQLISDVYDAMGRGDVAHLVGAMDPQIEWREAEGSPYESSGGPLIGTDAIFENVFIRFVTEWDGFAFRPERFHDAGATVIVEGRYTGTHNATGKDLDAQVCHVWMVRDDKIVSFQQYVDTGHWRDVVSAE